MATPPRLWRLLPHDRHAVDQLARSLQTPAIVAQLLLNRGVEAPDAARRFLDAPLTGLHKPETLPGVPEAVDRIFHAIEAGRKICVYGDYDVDGVTGSAILMQGNAADRSARTDREPGVFALGPVARHGNHQRRPAILLCEPARDDADDAAVPLRTRKDEGGVVLPALGVDHLSGADDGVLFHRLAHLVERFEVLGEVHRAFTATRREQLHRDDGLAEPAHRVEAWREAEADIPRLHPRPEDHLRGLAQGREADRGFRGEARQSIANEDAIFVGERNDIGDDAEGDESGGVEEHFPEGGRDFLAAALAYGERPGELEGDARAAQQAEGVRRARQARMDEDIGGRQFVLHLVVIGDDEFHAQPPGFVGFCDAGDAAIDGNHHTRAARRDLAQRVAVEAVALVESAGDVEVRAGAEQREHLHQDGGAGDAVHVVIAVDAYLASRLDRVEDAIDRLGHTGQRLRLVQSCQRGIEKPARGVRCLDATIEQELGHDRRGLERPRQMVHGVTVVRQQPPEARKNNCHIRLQWLSRKKNLATDEHR